MATQKTAVVVVSHYNAWPTDQLVKLLDQIQAIPSGHPFSVQVVVNKAEDKPLELPDRHGEVAVSYRENTGYNIGAWEDGWRQEPRADYYLFLQEECVIVGPDWLKAFIQAADRPKVGAVGEIYGFYNTTWDDVHEATLLFNDDPEMLHYRSFLTKQGIKFGEMADHLKSLVLCLRREVLEAIGGFRVGITKHEAIAAEIGISKSVQSLGLKIHQIGYRPFRYIHHPQWEKERREADQPAWMLRRLASMYLLARFQRKRREQSRRRRGWSPTVPTAPGHHQSAAHQPDSTV